MLVVIGYLLGDLWILPKLGNVAATIGDFIINALGIWAMTEALPQFTLSTSGYWIIALALAAGEWFFHQYLLGSQASEKR